MLFLLSALYGSSGRKIANSIMRVGKQDNNREGQTARKKLRRQEPGYEKLCCDDSNSFPRSRSRPSTPSKTAYCALTMGRGAKLLVLLFAEGSDSMLSLLPALALALPVRLFTGGFGGNDLLTPACSTWFGWTMFP